MYFLSLIPVLPVFPNTIHLWFAGPPTPCCTHLAEPSYTSTSVKLSAITLANVAVVRYRTRRVPYPPAVAADESTSGIPGALFSCPAYTMRRYKGNSDDHFRRLDRSDFPIIRYRTIMSYSCGTPSANYFSNPDVTYLDKPTGTATEDNARAIRDNMVRGNDIPPIHSIYDWLLS